MRICIHIFFLALILCPQLYGQTYTETIDTFFVPSPEYSITLGVDSLHFPCAITLPDSGTNFPVLILVHGSSALDKDANSTKDFLDSIGGSSRKAQTRMFYEIADSLSRNGIAVLRYDKRSFTVNCIEKPSCWFADTVSPYDYINDIHYAIQFAKTIPGIDTCNIFLAGHSQGGNFVTDVGYKRDDISGVITLATTAQPIDTVAVFQVLTVNSDPVGSSILRTHFDSLRAGLWPMTDTLYEQHYSPRFWLDWIQITDSALITQQLSTTPSLIMYGTHDRFVPPSTHITLWTDSITRPGVSFIVFDSLDHSFGTEFDSTMSPAVLDTLIQWIHNNSVNCLVNISPEISPDASLTLYPNPNTGKFKVKVENSPALIQIFTAQGTLVQENWVRSREAKFNVKGLTPGLYYLRAKHEQNVKSIRFLVR